MNKAEAVFDAMVPLLERYRLATEKWKDKRKEFRNKKCRVQYDGSHYRLQYRVAGIFWFTAKRSNYLNDDVEHSNPEHFEALVEEWLNKKMGYVTIEIHQ